MAAIDCADCIGKIWKEFWVADDFWHGGLASWELNVGSIEWRA